jgi:hypothetical protein
MTLRDSLPRRLVWVSSTAAVCILGILFVYWPIIQTRFGSVSSDMFDGRIMITLLEHWHNVFQLKEHPLDPIYFYPFKTTLAYNDANFVSGSIYTVFRAFGADPFLAYEFMNWTIRLVGAVSTIVLARKVFGLGLPYSLAAGLLVLIVTNLAYRMAHAQLLFTSFVPLGLLLFMSVFNHLGRVHAPNQWRAGLSILGFAAFIGFWAVTGFYSLYIFCLFLAVYFLALNVLSPETRHTVAKILTRRPGLVALMVLSFGVVVAGVLAIYGRALTAGHSVEGVRQFAGHPFDVLNIGSGNAVWSGFMASVYKGFTGKDLVSSEMSTGFTPILFLLFAASVVWLIQAYRTQRSPVVTMALALAIACLAIGFLTLKIGDHAVWEPFFHYVPGAKALRVPMRFLLFITPIVIVVALLGLSRGLTVGQLTPTGLTPLAAVALMVITAEQFRVDLLFHINRTAEMAFLRSIPRPPVQCRSFYVSVPRLPPTGNPGIDAFYIHSVDAMLIAELRKIPTLNGFATFTPAGWDLHTPFAPDYNARALAYADRMGVREGLCALDLKTRKWALV